MFQRNPIFLCAWVCLFLLFPIADSDEDLESVHEAKVDLTKSTATKRNRARQILKTPEKKCKCVLFLSNTCTCVILPNSRSVTWP